MFDSYQIRLRGLAEESGMVDECRHLALGHVDMMFHVFCELGNLRLFLKFEAIQPKKRIINKVVGGVVTIGSAPAPIEIYQGPTGRGKLKKSLPTSGSDQVACNPRSQPEPVQERG